MIKFYLVYMNENDNIRIDDVGPNGYNDITADQFYAGKVGFGYSGCEYIGKANTAEGIVELINNF